MMLGGNNLRQMCVFSSVSNTIKIKLEFMYIGVRVSSILPLDIAAVVTV